MGSLIAWGAVGGAGKGLSAVGKEAQSQVGQEKHDARQVQLQRQRDAAAQERQTTADTAASDRMKAEWGEEGFRHKFAEMQAGIATTKQEDEQRHDFQIEELKQKEATNRALITSGETEYQWEHTEAETVFDPFQNKYTTTEASHKVTDSSGTYDQTGSKHGVIFVHAQMEPPSADKIAAGFELMQKTKWLLTAGNDRALQNERRFKFLYSYGFLPAEYFAAYDPRGRQEISKASVSTTKPANQ